MGGAEPRTHGRNGEAGPGTKAVSHLGENISCIGSGCGQGGEECGLAGRLNGVDHPQLGVLQVRGLAVGVDEHKDVVHTYGREPQASRGRLRIMLLSPNQTHAGPTPTLSGPLQVRLQGSPASQPRIWKDPSDFGSTHQESKPYPPCSLALPLPQNEVP